MSTNTNLYDSFAKIVNEFGPGSAKDTADHFAELTCLHEDKLDHFMYYENATWRLLSLLEETKTKSNLYRFAELKQWVSQIEIDQDLADRIDEFNDVDDEITNLFNHVGIIHSNDGQEPPRKKRITTTKEQNNEIIYKQHFEKLRSNDFTPIATSNQNVSFNYMVNGFMQYQKMALMDEGSKIVDRERSIWKKAVMYDLKQKSTGKYRKALLSVLGGKSKELYNSTMCNTWEDVIWAYFNEKTEAMLDIPHSTANEESVLSKDIADIALSKDFIMEKGDPRMFFHYIQSAILSNQPQQTIREIYLAYTHNEKESQLNPGIYISDQPEERAQVLRFISTFILYGREYFGWQESLYSAALLSAYSDINAEPSVMRPVVIAAYAAKQSPNHQIKIYSNFLQNFDGDDEECSIVLQLGKEYGLDMPDILQFTYTHLFKKAISFAPNKVSAKTPDTLELELEGEITKDYAVFIQAIKWLTFDESMCIQAFQAANMTIRYLLGIYKIYLVQEIFKLFTDVMIERMSFEAKNHTNSQAILIEFDLHRSLMNSFIEYDNWEKLFENGPKDDGSLDSIMKVYNWRDEVEKKTIEISSEISRVLHGNWLAGESNETAQISKAALRQAYIPDLLIRYHHILYSTIFITPSNKEKCQGISQLITTKNEQILNDITLAKKMDEVVKELSKSLI